MAGLPSIERLREMFRYDAETGHLFWAERGRGRTRGRPIATMAKASHYRLVGINRQPHLQHRVIWMLCHGEIPSGYEIDHINGDVTDNRISNLRLATTAQNQWNQKLDKSGPFPRGVTYHAQVERYQARIRVNGQRLRSPWFKTVAEAGQAYVEMARKYHGDFTRVA